MWFDASPHEAVDGYRWMAERTFQNVSLLGGDGGGEEESADDASLMLFCCEGGKEDARNRGQQSLPVRSTSCCYCC